MVVLTSPAPTRDPEAYDDPDRFDLDPYGRGRAPRLLCRHPLLPGRWRDSRQPSPSSGSSNWFPRLQRAGRLRRRNGTVIRGPAELVVGQSATALAA